MSGLSLYWKNAAIKHYLQASEENEETKQHSQAVNDENGLNMEETNCKLI